MIHYHIRWSSKNRKTLDWERFDTAEKAEDSAKRLVLPGENYSIEQFDSDCLRCAAIKEHSASNERKTKSGGLDISPDDQDPCVQVL